MSMKKSILLLLAVMIAVTVFSVVSGGGNSMDIQMDADAISFSGIEDFRYRLSYADITELRMESVADWSQYGGDEFGHFRAGVVSAPGSSAQIVFVTTQIDLAIIASLRDGSQMIFNYNNSSGTQGIYEMLLENLQS